MSIVLSKDGAKFKARGSKHLYTYVVKKAEYMNLKNVIRKGGRASRVIFLRPLILFSPPQEPDLGVDVQVVNNIWSRRWNKSNPRFR